MEKKLRHECRQRFQVIFAVKVQRDGVVVDMGNGTKFL